MELNRRIAAIAERLTPQLVELRKQLHQHPELAFEEHETAKAVGSFLKKLGIPFRTGVGKTGIVAVLEGSGPGRTIGIRADMDALPIHEETGLPFASKVAGKMHACGHDVHTVIALGVAAALSEMKDSLQGRIKFIFQPAEETLSGAPAMIADGVLDEAPKMDAIIGYHNWPPVKAGSVGYHPEAVMASADAFDLTLKGRTGHGAHPHLADRCARGRRVLRGPGADRDQPRSGAAFPGGAVDRRIPQRHRAQRDRADRDPQGQRAHHGPGGIEGDRGRGAPHARGHEDRHARGL